MLNERCSVQMYLFQEVGTFGSIGEDNMLEN